MNDFVNAVGGIDHREQGRAAAVPIWVQAKDGVRVEIVAEIIETHPEEAVLVGILVEFSPEGGCPLFAFIAPPTVPVSCKVIYAPAPNMRTNTNANGNAHPHVRTK